ncbi:MAG: 4-alpha-glucanotransferase, partial [Bacteroidales bacterium]
MKINFNIDYHTSWGESLYVVVNQINEQPLKMNPNGSGGWSISLELADDVKTINYKYVVKDESGNLLKSEYGENHEVVISKTLRSVEVFDAWQDMPVDKPFHSSAFSNGFFNRERAAKGVAIKNNTIVIKVTAPMIKADEYLAISGDAQYLGGWDSAKAVAMNDYNAPQWSVALDATKLMGGFSYKFVVLKKGTNKPVMWEYANNRYFDIPMTKNSGLVQVSGLMFQGISQNWKCAGVAIPVFSVRTEEDFGIGDFFSLKKVIDWAALTNQRVVQILPINDTTMTHTWTDSYPYNANSTFALHPMYINLKGVGTLSDDNKQAEYDALAKELNTLTEIDYERVNDAKTAYLKDLYAEIGAKVKATAAYKKFVKSNEYWLAPYAAFTALRDVYGTPDFSQWGEYANYSAEKVAKIFKEYKSDVEFTYFIQYYLDKQLSEVREYAHKNSVVLKGDIPIGISRTSADAWVYPKLFNMDCQAGAPPDDFAVLGQNWGFPTYNWEEMNKDGFKWWKDRFTKMAEYFDAYRIDHILGFFRIWQIPMDAVHGLLGAFSPAMPYSADELRDSYDFWINHDLHTKPFIMDYFVGDFFGEYTQEVKSLYLDDDGWGKYKFKPEFDTQRKVADYFETLEKSDKNSVIMNGLLALHDEVLFIEDATEKYKYHPRISAQHSKVYGSLNEYEKWCYNRMYNDFFYNRHNDFWYGKAMWKLPALVEATNML